MRAADALVWMIAAAPLVPAHAAARRAGSATLATLLVLEALLALGALFAAVDERAWVRAAQEDGAIEWASAFAFAIAGGMHLAHARALRASGAIAVLCSVMVGAFCLFVAGEELSWGQRMLAVEPPEVFLARSEQQELNLHNLLMNERGLGVRIELSAAVLAVALAFGVLGPWAARSDRLRGLRAVFPPLPFAPVFLAVCAIEASYRVELAGEGAELLLGLAFMGARTATLDVRRALLWLSLPLLLGAATSGWMARAHAAGDPARSDAARNELALLAQDVREGQRDALDGKRLVHKRMFQAVREGYLRLDGGAFLEGRACPAGDGAEPRRDRRGYLLDPWNNPYWMFFSRDTQQIALYSFGPNRRRDTDFKARGAPAGDDLVVFVPRNTASR